MRRRLGSTASWAAIGLLLSLGATAAAPALAAPLKSVDALPFSINPDNGHKESIVQTLSTNVYLTDQGTRIIDATAINDTFVWPASGDTYKVTAVTTDAITGRVTAVTAVDVTTGSTTGVSFDRATAIIPNTVFNPDTGKYEAVGKVFSLSTVLTTDYNIVVLPAVKDDIIYLPGSTEKFKVTKVYDDGHGHALLDVTGSGGTNKTGVTFVTYAKTELDKVPLNQIGTGATGSSTSLIASPSGEHAFTKTGTGDDGAGGKDGGGVEICFGLLGCIDIAYHPTSGDAGAPGPDFIETVDAAKIAPDNHLFTKSNKTPGISLTSFGGNGGKGGDAYGNIDAAPGGGHDLAEERGRYHHDRRRIPRHLRQEQCR
ncbi:MAG: hypothetical protein JF571_04085 [Asticcacaulis sp.]|nr:hypothetical protein [Asticcacaulis sp.]